MPLQEPLSVQRFDTGAVERPVRRCRSRFQRVHRLWSLVHAYWKRFYARRFAEHGFRTELEAPRSGGRVDVLATRAGERFGIEIETGKSDVVANVRNGLRSRFDRVLVVVTDETALARVERQIASAGLLIPGRIELVLRDGLGRAAWGSGGG